jgi:hypothetical protein
LCTTAPITSVAVSPVNSRCPVSISYRMQPNDQTSARRSTGLPRACSGLMYPAVPKSTPRPVIACVRVGDNERSCAPESPDIGSAVSAFAKPKSSTLTRPSGVIFTFAGFRSRCTTPFSCAASTASAICSPSRAASST